MRLPAILSCCVALILTFPLTSSGQIGKSDLFERSELSGDGKKVDLDSQVGAEGFGVAVAISGRLAFVGESRGSLEQGTVTVFHRDSTTEAWSQETILTASGSTIGNHFGELIDADSHRVIVGAPRAFGGQGAAYIFARQSPGVWVQEGVVQSDIPTASQWYAETSVSISGVRAIVGETHWDGANRGAAHIYKYDSGAWISDTTLPWINDGHRFGFAAAISRDRAVVGAYRWQPTTGLLNRVGKVYVYTHAGNAWSLTHELAIPDSLKKDHFGYVVDIDRERIAVVNVSTNVLRPPGFRIFDFVMGTDTWALRDSISSPGFLAIDLDSATVISGLGGLNEVIVLSGSTANSSWSQEDTLNGVGVLSGDNFGHDVGLSGDYAVVGAPGDFSGASNAYFFERQPDSTWLQVAAFIGSGSTPASITGAAVPCSGGMAGIFECKDIELKSYLNSASLLATGHMSDIWGWTDSVTGHEYALITHGGGTSFVDVTDPVNPELVGVLPMHSGTVNSAWRDVKTYGDFAFVVADNAGPQGIQVFDLKELRLAQGLPGAASKTRFATVAATLPVTFSETFHYDKFSEAHNIAINDSSATAFIVGSSLCGGGIYMVDISNPLVPDSTGCYADAGTGRSSTGYTHDIQCVKYHGPDTGYSGNEICFGSNETAVLISDVTDNSTAVTVGKGEYPDYGYVHQGWLTDDHRYFIQNDELDERGGLASQTRTLFWDVTDLTDPILVYEYLGPTAAIDHNHYVLGRYLYQAQYTAGVRIVDISGITEAPATTSKAGIVAPIEVAYFDTQPGQDLTSFSGVWSVYPYFASGNMVVSSIGEGLFVLRPGIAEVSVDITVFLEGPFVTGVDSMATSGSFQSAVPNLNPYGLPVFDGSALEHDVADSVNALPPKTIDWVEVELRTGTESSSAVVTRAAILLTDGSIVDPNGNALAFPGIAPDNYYVVVRHRNHLSVISSSAADLSSGSGSWNFTTSTAQALGTRPMTDLGDSKWGMFAGEADLNGLNSTGDFNLWLVDTKAVATGYLLADFNMDGQVLANDFNVWLLNTKAAAASGVPE